MFGTPSKISFPPMVETTTFSPTIYHFTTVHGAKDILTQNMLKASKPYDESPYAISFTRNKNLWLQTVRLTIDGDKLSQRFKIEPYIDELLIKRTTGVSSLFRRNAEENEERIVFNSGPNAKMGRPGKIENIISYIKEVTFHLSLNRDDPDVKEIKNLCEARGIPYFPKSFPKSFTDFEESLNYTTWKLPDDKSLKHEYDVEYEHHFKYIFGDIFPTFEDWKNAIRKGEVLTVTPEIDKTIANRSHRESIKQIVDLIKGYRSYPEFRNEDTVNNIKERMLNNEPLDMPLVYNNSGKLRIVSGDTRMNIAHILGIAPKVVVFSK